MFFILFWIQNYPVIAKYYLMGTVVPYVKFFYAKKRGQKFRDGVSIYAKNFQSSHHILYG